MTGTTATDTVSPLLSDLARAGVRLRLVDDRIEVSAPRGRLTGELRERISRHRSGLIARLRGAQESGPAAVDLPTIVPDPDALYEPFPLTDLQQSFLIGGREGFEYHVRPHQYLEFDFDELDPVRFAGALNTVLRRHRRSLVVIRDDMRLQTVRDPAQVTVTVTDLRGLPPDEADRRLSRIRRARERQEPEHHRWPWIEPHLSIYGDGRARLHYNNNNIFTDAPSGAGLIADALRCYRHPDLDLPELELSFRDCALALAALEASPLGRESERYWLARSAGWPGPPDLPLVPSNDHHGRSMLHRRELSLPAPQWAALKGRAEAYGVTPTNALLGAHVEVLAGWSGSRHFLLNNMISHRPIPLHPQMSHVLGNFAALYPLEVDWRPREPFRARVQRLQRQVMADVAHSYCSGTKVLQVLSRARRTPGRAVCPYAVGSALFVGPTDRPFYSTLETPQALLDTEFWELPDGSLLVIWDVIDAMFPPGLITDMFAGYATIVERLASDEAAWHQQAFALLSEPQRERRAALNRSDRPVVDGLLHDPLHRWAASHPDRPAVLTAQGSVSYRELRRRSLRLAELLRDGGVRPGDRVAVVLPKGQHQVVGVLAVLCCAGAYVPIDPSWPQQRIRLLLADTGAAAVVSTASLAGRLAALTEVPVAVVDGAAAGRAPAGPALPRARPDDLAYIIYTSGSTGAPKGAMLDHRGPLNTISDLNRRFGIGADDRVFGVSSLCFDLSVYDIFGTLAAGGTLVLPAAGQADPASYLDQLASACVTVWNSVPAVMQLAVEAAEAAGVRLPSLRTVLLSGDWIPVGLPDRIRRIAAGARVVGLGGATEASIWSIAYPIDEVDPSWPSIPYGRPLANQTWHVLDEYGRDVPTWVPGELYIGGVGLARGYWADPERTAAAFVTHPHTGARLYRTGDLGRYLPGGDIEFLGRADLQVKIQGYRVEPGEVEHALLTHPEVGQAAVTARRSGSGRQLVAAVVPAGAGAALDPAALRSYLRERLPEYLVPSHVAVLAELPLTGNGKVDRRALAAPGGSDQDGKPSYVAARTPTEATLVSVWESILATGPIGTEDDFFDLGGQSFAALRVVASAGERLGRRVPVGVLLERRTIAGLAAWLDSPQRAWSPLTRLGGAGTDQPWFLVHPAGGTVACYRGLAERLGGPVYGLQAPGPASGHEALDEVPAFAELYLRALVQAQPGGPYRLGGWSSGAVIAAEMTAQLERRGAPVELLLVIDAPAPVAPRQVSEVDLVLWFLEDLGLGLDPNRVGAGARAELAALAGRDRLRRALALLPAQGVPDAGLDHRELADTFAVFRGVVVGCNHYRASRLATDLTVVQAARPVVAEFADHPGAGRADWGWAQVTDGRVAASVLPGTHHTLLTDPATVAAIASAVGGHRRQEEDDR
jgi:amino acid adenylation domain-containing protein